MSTGRPVTPSKEPTTARLREKCEAGARSLRLWHDVPIFEGRDLASGELWEIPLAHARSKRELAKSPPRLPKARRASVSLVAPALAMRSWAGLLLPQGEALDDFDQVA